MAEMNLYDAGIPGVKLINTPPAYEDERGLLRRMFDQRLFSVAGIDISWKQQTYQVTKQKNVLRGLYTQLPPHGEAKLVTLLWGEVQWVILDVRQDSSDFGKCGTYALSPQGINGLFVPSGFAHGCLTLSSESHVVIDTDNYYAEEHGAGIVWDDPELGIEWAVTGNELIISPAHKEYPSFKDFKMRYGGV
jgi:dTDP-4-dehydrorhamnose 3,5-epimerase